MSDAGGGPPASPTGQTLAGKKRVHEDGALEHATPHDADVEPPSAADAAYGSASTLHAEPHDRSEASCVAAAPVAAAGLPLVRRAARG